MPMDSANLSAGYLDKWHQYRALYGRRGRWSALLAKAVPWSVLTRARPPQLPCALFLRTRTSDEWTYEQVFVDREYDLPLPVEPRVIVDCGANVGYAAAYFAHRYPQARVVAVEPDAQNFAVLVRNARLFGRRIEPLRAALWNADERIVLQDPGLGAWGLRTVRAVPEQVDATVDAVTMESLLRRLGLEAIDLLKVDIEGAECELFEHPAPWIQRVRIMAVELHDRFRPGCTDALMHAVRLGGFTHEIRRGEHRAFCRQADLANSRAAHHWQTIDSAAALVRGG